MGPFFVSTVAGGTAIKGQRPGARHVSWEAGHQPVLASLYNKDCIMNALKKQSLQMQPWKPLQIGCLQTKNVEISTFVSVKEQVRFQIGGKCPYNDKRDHLV